MLISPVLLRRDCLRTISIHKFGRYQCLGQKYLRGKCYMGLKHCVPVKVVFLFMSLFGTSSHGYICGWNIFFNLKAAACFTCYIYYTVYYNYNLQYYIIVLHDYHLSFNQKQCHFTSLSKLCKEKRGKQTWFDIYLIMFFYEETREYEQGSIFYRAACVLICVAGMTSVSLCWDRKILSYCHCHKSNTIMKWHHNVPVIKWTDCCLGVFTRLGDIVSNSAAYRRIGYRWIKLWCYKFVECEIHKIIIIFMFFVRTACYHALQ